MITVPCQGTRRPTQLLLKQSCEQKLLSFPILRQLGHCSEPASLEQSTPTHGFFAEAAMVVDLKRQRVCGGNGALHRSDVFETGRTMV